MIIMVLIKTSRLKKHDSVYEIEIPEEIINKLEWTNGFVLEVSAEKDKLIIEKLHGFMGS